MRESYAGAFRGDNSPMQKLLLVLAIPLAFFAVLVAIEVPQLGFLGFVVPVAVFVWMLRRLRHAPAPDRGPAITPAAPGEVVDAIFDDDVPAETADSRPAPASM
jgi:hypothetical protein